MLSSSSAEAGVQYLRLILHFITLVYVTGGHAASYASPDLQGYNFSRYYCIYLHNSRREAKQEVEAWWTPLQGI